MPCPLNYFCMSSDRKVSKQHSIHSRAYIIGSHLDTNFIYMPSKKKARERERYAERHETRRKIEKEKDTKKKRIIMMFIKYRMNVSISLLDPIHNKCVCLCLCRWSGRSIKIMKNWQFLQRTFLYLIILCGGERVWIIYFCCPRCPLVLKCFSYFHRIASCPLKMDKTINVDHFLHTMSVCMLITENGFHILYIHNT